MLTDRGLQFVGEVEARLAAGEAVLYACYEVATKSIVYAAGELVFPPPPKTLLDFSSADEGGRWTVGAGPYGVRGEGDVVGIDGDEAAKAEAVGAEDPRCSYSGHLSLRVTPDHRMYVQMGHEDEQGNVQWSGMHSGPTGQQRRRVECPPAIRSASSLLSACDCPPAAAGEPDCRHRRALVRFQPCADNGHWPEQPRWDVQLDAQTALDLTDAQLPCFLELFGFWVGQGSLSYEGQGAIVFARVRESERAWLSEMFAKVGVSPSYLHEQTASRGSVVVQSAVITDPRWFAFFDREYGVLYSGSQYFDPAAAAIAQGSITLRKTTFTTSEGETQPPMVARKTTHHLTISLLPSLSH